MHIKCNKRVVGNQKILPNKKRVFRAFCLLTWTKYAKNYCLKPLFTFIIYLCALTIYLYYDIIIISKFATARLKNGYFEQDFPFSQRQGTQKNL